MAADAGPSDTRPRGLAARPGLLLLPLAAVVAGVFLWFMLAATEGHFVPQVVDLYLVCQYARAMVEGHPFRYNAGELPSTGATSLLHTVVLAIAHAVGFRGEGLVAFAIVAGAGLYFGSVMLARAVAARLAGPREGLLAGVLVALGGPVVWSFLYGSDIALFLFLALWLFERWLASGEGARPRWTAPGVLLALARPEGLPIAIALAGAWTWRRRTDRGLPTLGAWLPVVAGLAVMGLYRLVTGSWLGTSVRDKSLFASYGINQGLALSAEYLVDIVRGLLLGLYPSQVPIGMGRGWASMFFPPLALIAILAALVFATAVLRYAVIAWTLMLAGLFLLVTPSVFLGAHFQRYLLWAFPGLLALAAAGLGHITTWAFGVDPARERVAFRAMAGIWVALAALSTARFATLYGEMAGEVYRRDVAAAQWMLRHVPPGTRMANLATSVEYLTGHQNLNLHGVTSPAFFGDHAAEREADAFEALGRLSPAERPPYLIATVSALDRFPAMRALVSPPALFRSASFGDEIEIYRTQYDLLTRGAQPLLPSTLAAVGALAEVDRLNVCDSRDEAAHEYSFTSSTGTAPLWGTVRIDAYPGTEVPIADGGRAILGRESFRVHAQPGRDLIVVLRTAGAIDANLLQAGGPRRVGVEFPESALTIVVDGQSPIPGTHTMTPGWNELVLRVTGNLVRSARPRIEISGRYASFRYWFFQ